MLRRVKSERRAQVGLRLLQAYDTREQRREMLWRKAL